MKKKIATLLTIFAAVFGFMFSADAITITYNDIDGNHIAAYDQSVFDVGGWATATLRGEYGTGKAPEKTYLKSVSFDTKSEEGIDPIAIEKTTTYKFVWKGANLGIEYAPNSKNLLFGDVTLKASYKEDETSFATVNLPEAVKKGYTFTHWTTPLLDIPVNSEFTPTIDMNYHFEAHYIANNYTVRFDANGGVGTMEDMSMTYDAEEIALTANTFEKTGYTFAGWSEDPNATEVAYADKALVNNLTSEGVVTLYAVWIANTYTIDFDDEAIEDIKATYDETVTLPEGTEKEGFEFIGYSTEEDATEAEYFAGEAVSNLTAKDKATVTLYSVYEVAKGKVVVHFVDTKGNTIKADQEFEGVYGEEYSLDEVTIDGYVFVKATLNRIGTYKNNTTEITFVYDVAGQGTATDPEKKEETKEVSTNPNTGDEGMTFVSLFGLSLLGLLSSGLYITRKEN